MSSYTEKNPSGYPKEFNTLQNNFTLKGALMAVEQGYSVIPLEPRGKKPIVDWQEYQHVRATEEEVHEWYTRNPNINYGIVTGSISGITVLDVDAKYGGLDTLEKIRDRLPEVPIVATGGGGCHFYFSHNGEGCTSNTGIGLDIKAEGGYVVGAGSIHESGNEYVYELETYSSGVMPSFVNEMVKAKPKPEPVMESSTTGTAIAEGERNKTLTSRAGVLHRKGLKPAEIEAVLLHLNATECKPSLVTSEVQKIVESITRYERDTPTRSYNSQHSREWASIPIPPLEYHVKTPPIVKGDVVVLAASPKAGKSTFARHAAVAKANGEEFLGEQLRPCNVLYLAIEENPNDVKRAFKTLGVTDNTPLWVHFPPLADYAETIEGIKQDIRENDIELVFIDTAMMVKQKTFDSTDYNKVREWAFPFLEMAHELGATVVLLHHETKKGRGAEGFDATFAVHGSTALVAAVDSVLNLHRDNNGTRTIQEVGRHGNAEGIILNFNEETQKLSHGGTKAEYAQESKEDEILVFMEGKGELSRLDIAKPEKDGGVGGNSTAVTAALKHLVEIGKLNKRKDGSKHIYSLRENEDANFSVSNP